MVVAGELARAGVDDALVEKVAALEAERDAALAERDWALGQVKALAPIYDWTVHLGPMAVSIGQRSGVDVAGLFERGLLSSLSGFGGSPVVHGS